MPEADSFARGSGFVMIDFVVLFEGSFFLVLFVVLEDEEVYLRLSFLLGHRDVFNSKSLADSHMMDGAEGRSD